MIIQGPKDTEQRKYKNIQKLGRDKDHDSKGVGVFY